MAYLLTKEEMDPQQPYAEFISGDWDGGEYLVDRSLYLHFSHITKNEQLLALLEDCLGFDYYGPVTVLPEAWERFVEACEEHPDCEIATDLMEELADWVSDSFEEFEKFYLIGL